MSEELKHYGVKGMRWGVRKDRATSNKPRTKEEQAKRERNKKIAITAVSVVAVSVGAYAVSKYSNTHLDKTIKAGKNMQRVSKYMDTPLKDVVYASHLKSDNKGYRTWFAAMNGSQYVKNMTSEKDIKIAGTKEAKKTFESLLKNDEQIKSKFENMDVDKAFKLFNKDTLFYPGMEDTQMASKYYSELSKKGYSAVRDVNDQVNSKVTSPLIIFGGKDSLTVNDVKKITPKEIPKKYRNMFIATTSKVNER